MLQSCLEWSHSTWCNAANINASAIAAASSLVARSLYILASEKKEINDSVLTSVSVNSSLIDELLGCLLECEPGLSCDLVNQYISPSAACPSHYVGVIQGEPSSSPYPGYVGDVSRFLWNFLADKTSVPSENRSATCPKDCNGAGELCIRVETDGNGVCVISSTRYHSVCKLIFVIHSNAIHSDVDWIAFHCTLEDLLQIFADIICVP